MRLTTIINEIKGHTLLDIGTDHAYVLIRALQEKRIEKGIAVEIAKQPLKRAISNAKKHGVYDQISFVLSDGFKQVNEAYDIVSITGLGFDTIKHILSQPHQKPAYYILSTHSKLIELRQFLSNNNFTIKNEILVYDKRFYSIIIAINGQQDLSEEDIILSPILKGNIDSIPFYEQELNKINMILSKTTDKNNKVLYFMKTVYENNLKSLKKQPPK